MNRQTLETWVRTAEAAGAPAGHLTLPLRLAVLVAVLLVFAAVPARGQAPLRDEPAASPSEPGLAIDAETLLHDEQVLPERIDTGVWQIEPNPGRRLVVLPLLVTPTEQEAELGPSPSLGVRGGRFLTWIVEVESDDDRRRRTRRASRPQNAFMPYEAEPDEAPDASTLPEGAPRLARRITVHPDGRVQWRLERAIPNATVSESDEPYVLRIRPDRLREMEPRRERIEVGENTDRAELARRRREIDREFLAQRRAFMETRREVMALPDEFEVRRPTRVWAVFEIAARIDELAVTGEQALLPWSIRFDDLLALRAFAGAGGRRGSDEPATLNRLARLAGDGHELTHRLLAHAVITANVIPAVEVNEPLYNLLQQLLRSEDPATRRAVLAELAAVMPPTTASMTLLRAGAAQADPTMKLLALRGLLQADPGDPMRLTQMLNSANDLLIDRQGPEPPLVLAELVEAIGTREEVIAHVAANVRFEPLPGDRLEAAIGYVVAVAGEQPLAAAWLDQQLLGSANPNVVQQTLERIASANRGGAWLQTAAHTAMAALFGPPVEGDDAPAEAIALSRHISIDSARHSLFRSLNSGHEQIRQLAWQSLRNFTFDDANADARRSRRFAPADADDLATDRYTALVDAALGRPQTPSQVVPFLARQAQVERVNVALLQLLLAADDAAALQAGRALVDAERSIGSALLALSGPEREHAVNRLYDRVEGTSPAVTSLLRESDRGRGGVNEWFGEQIAEGRLPEPREWAEAFRGEEALLDLAGGADEDLAAGAVAALVYAAGGDEIAVAEQIDHFRQLRGADRDALQEAWSSARQDIYARRLSQAEGSYRLVAIVQGRDEGQAMPERFDAYNADATAAPAVQTRITLGVVDLTADGRSVRLSNDIVPLTLAPDRLAIRIERVRELNNFNNEELAELEMDQVREPLDLLPGSDGTWAGSVHLYDGQQLELRMEPVE
ncbi:MAG: hypothetical protein WDZ31_10250 [Phycisphaeraceae bacterium]